MSFEPHNMNFNIVQAEFVIITLSSPSFFDISQSKDGGGGGEDSVPPP